MTQSSAKPTKRENEVNAYILDKVSGVERIQPGLYTKFVV